MATRRADHDIPTLWTRRARPPGAVRLGEIRAMLEALAPLHLAESWDNVGLLSGDDDKLVREVLLTIDVTPAVASEARQRGTDLIFSYHPPLFRPLQTLRMAGLHPASLAIDLATRGTWIYSPHTALDTAQPGTNDILAEAVGAKVTGSFVHSAGRGTNLKLVVFVPESAVDAVAEAVFAAGAGHIGANSRYTKCSFRTPGTGTFLGGSEAHPTVGRRGRLELVPEIRLETILPAAAAPAVIAALRSAHPYEEPAFDLLQMQTPPEAVGLGRYAELPNEMPLKDFAEVCKKAVGVTHAWIVGDPKRRIRRLGLIAGSAGTLGIESGDPGRYDCMLTGELKHHVMLAYAAAGLSAVCVGHGNSERPVLGYIAKQLRHAFPRVVVKSARADRDPFLVV